MPISSIEPVSKDNNLIPTDSEQLLLGAAMVRESDISIV